MSKFKDLQTKIIKKDFGKMNDMQFEAVTTVNGPLLVLAGAGSGKTTVLVNRIAYLIKFGNALKSEEPEYTQNDLELGESYLRGETSHIPPVFKNNPASPYEILAITFTNKAAEELKNRISNILGETGNVLAGTFHSVCAKILRISGGVLGYTSDFTIYDTNDQKSIIKDIFKTLNVSEKDISVKHVSSEISKAKEAFLSPEEYEKSGFANYTRSLIAKIYAEYKARLKKNNAMDFDDLIINTVKLFENFKDIRLKYAKRFKYVMVDEYQDTNLAQYKLVTLMASFYNNLCVVGDDDQSIYSFRGATIENILNFENEFPGAKVIRLEQNYRSTKTILNAANAIISNNIGRKGKELWTSLKEDSKIEIATLESETAEANYVAEKILNYVKEGKNFSDFAVLYRMNAQSNAVENVFARSGVPYRIIGGHRFFDRKEIKDVMSYLSLINNKNDSVRLKRIINEPKRGIGTVTLNKAESIASALKISLFEVLENVENYPQISRSAKNILPFCKIINDLAEYQKTHTLSEVLNEALNKTGYMDMLVAEGELSYERIENVNELKTSIKQFEKENGENATIAGFLEEVSLISDIDNYDSSSDVVTLMTLHAAKGLEFNTVFLVGMEEGIFPGNQSVYGGLKEIEEERRLAYVGVTRARRKLYITNAYTRMLFGTTNRNLPSRFLKEIPEECCNIKEYNPISFNSYNSYNSYNNSRNSYGSQKGFSYSGTGNRSGYENNGGYGYGTGGGYSNQTSSTFKPAVKKPAKAKKVYCVGNRVKHNTFGEGTILNVTNMGNDSLLEIAFDKIGTKKIMANFAKLEDI